MLACLISGCALVVLHCIDFYCLMGYQKEVSERAYEQSEQAKQVERCGALWSTVEYCGALRSAVQRCGANERSEQPSGECHFANAIVT